MKQNRRPRNNVTQIQPSHITLEKGQPLQQMVLGKLDIFLLKLKTRPLSLTLYKNQLQMGQRS
jgi:hypothetical protein